MERGVQHSRILDRSRVILTALLILPTPFRVDAMNLSFPEGLYWPRIDARTRFTRIDDPITIDLDPIRQAMLKLQAMNCRVEPTPFDT